MGAQFSSLMFCRQVGKHENHKRQASTNSDNLEEETYIKLKLEVELHVRDPSCLMEDTLRIIRP